MIFLPILLPVFYLLNVGFVTSFTSPSAQQSPVSRNNSRRSNNKQSVSKPTHYYYLSLRGGQVESEKTESQQQHVLHTTNTNTHQMSTVTAAVVSFGQYYVQSLERYPIRTKSVTAGCIFALSDWLAQTLSGENKDQHDYRRTVAASLVGLLYFGPAAHYWYEHIFKLFPATGIVSTLQKALMGQLFFGPSFTCIFFATSLIQSGDFTFGNWFRKIQSDLAGAWLAGAGFWPLVDLVSYSLVPPRFIPLFVNVCSLVWNIYLSIVANRRGNKTATA